MEDWLYTLSGQIYFSFALRGPSPLRSSPPGVSVESLRCLLGPSNFRLPSSPSPWYTAAKISALSSQPSGCFPPGLGIWMHGSGMSQEVKGNLCTGFGAPLRGTLLFEISPLNFQLLWQLWTSSLATSSQEGCRVFAWASVILPHTWSGQCPQGGCSLKFPVELPSFKDWILSGLYLLWTLSCAIYELFFIFYWEFIITT